MAILLGHCVSAVGTPKQRENEENDIFRGGERVNREKAKSNEKATKNITALPGSFLSKKIATKKRVSFI